MANVMVFCGGHSPGENNCKCFVGPVNMLFFSFFANESGSAQRT